jgi:type IV secretory pathway TrbD component
MAARVRAVSNETDIEFHPVYRTLHRTLTLCGVDRRLFFLALLAGAGTFNLFYSLLAGCLVFCVIYGLALWLAAIDAQSLQILLRSASARTRYDSAKPTNNREVTR